MPVMASIRPSVTAARQSGVVPLGLVGVGLGEVGDRLVEGRTCPGRRRSRSGRRTGRAPAPASTRRARRRAPALGGSICSIDASPSSPAADACRSRGDAVEAGRRAASRGRCRSRPASGADRRRPAGRGWCTRWRRGSRLSTERWASLACRNSGSAVAARAAGSTRGCRRCRPRPPCGPCR